MMCIYWAILDSRGTPLKGQAYFKLQIWEFHGSNFDLKKMGILKFAGEKNVNSKFSMSKTCKKLGIPILYYKR